MPFLSILLLALVILTLVDVITRDESQVRHMPRFVWLLLVILLPLIGSILWFTIGREYPEGGVRLARPPATITLANLLKGGLDACGTEDDRDTLGTDTGWWFYVNYEAAAVTYTGVVP